mgnify:CR=1 FL=1
MNEVKPRFEVHKEKGKIKRTFCTPKTDEDGKLLGGFDYEEKLVDAGWMVYLPNGSSLRVLTKDEMVRQGFLNNPTLIDMQSGEHVPAPGTQSLKQRSEQKERVTKSSNVAHTS